MRAFACQARPAEAVTAISFFAGRTLPWAAALSVSEVFGISDRLASIEKPAVCICHYLQCTDCLLSQVPG